MNTWYNRLSAILTSAVMGGCFAIALIAFTSWFLYKDIQPSTLSLELHNVAMHYGADGYYKKRSTDVAFFRFGLRADFSPLFTWNTKQVFLLAVVSYKSAEFRRNEVVIWDRIIQREDLHVLDEADLSGEYTMADIKNALGGTKATLELRWSVTSWNGPIRDYRMARPVEFTFPPAVDAKKP